MNFSVVCESVTEYSHSYSIAFSGGPTGFLEMTLDLKKSEVEEGIVNLPMVGEYYPLELVVK